MACKTPKYKTEKLIPLQLQLSANLKAKLQVEVVGGLVHGLAVSGGVVPVGVGEWGGG